MYYVSGTAVRFKAKIVDHLLITVLSMPLLMQLFEQYETQGEIVFHWSKALVLLAIVFSYEFVFYALFSATPGKLFYNLKLVPAKDSSAELGFLQIFLRILVTKLSIFVSWAIYSLVLFTYDRTHLADWIGETRVVAAAPRLKRSSKRYLLGSFLVIYFLIDGFTSSQAFWRSLTYEDGYFTLTPAEMPSFSFSEAENDQ